MAAPTVSSGWPMWCSGMRLVLHSTKEGSARTGLFMGVRTKAAPFR